MKRVIIYLLIAAMLLSLCGCGEHKIVNEAIYSIGEVNLESGDAILYAEALYNVLSDEDKEKVLLADTLFEARETYDALVAEHEEKTADFEAVKQAVENIGAVDENSAELIREARLALEAYEEKWGSEGLDKLHAEILAATDEYTKACRKAELEDIWDVFYSGDYAKARDMALELQERYPYTEYADEAASLIVDTYVLQVEEALENGNAGLAMLLLEDYLDNCGSGIDSIKYASLRNSARTELNKIRPENGYIFENHIGSGYGEFTVMASPSCDAMIKLQSVEDEQKYALFYVRMGEQATIPVPDGNYVAKYTTGSLWYGEELRFGPKAGYTIAEDIMEFATRSDSMYIYYSSISITLYSVVGGDLETSEIDPDEF